MSGPQGQAAPPEMLAAPAYCCVLTNEPAEVGADLATRALLAGSSTSAGSGDPPWFDAAWFSMATFTLLWAERYAQLRPLLDVPIAEARRPATAACSQAAWPTAAGSRTDAAT